MVLHALHLCSGYGGFELGLRLAGVECRTVAHVERDAYAAATLVARMEQAHLDHAPVWSDLTTFDTGPWVGRVDLVTAGFPCQPFSSAGSQRGVDDDRWLWPAIGRIIGELGPRLVFLENVPGLVRAGLPHVLADLAELGFDAEWGLLSAAEVGAPHRRDRFWLLAHPTGIGGVHGGRLSVEQPERGRQRAGVHGEELADADSDGSRGERVPVRGSFDGTEARRRGAGVGHADSTRRPEVTRSAPRDEATHGWRQDRTNVADGASEDVADADGARPEGPGCPPEPAGTQVTGTCHNRQWPPARDDTDGWRTYIAEGGPQPAVRRGPDGRPSELADALHLGGNGLVPAVAAEAFAELATRLGIGKRVPR